MKRTALITLVLLLALCLGAAGCGGSINFTNWVGNYTGTGTLDNGKVGDLALSCDANGIVTGTLVVTGADGTDTKFKFTAGTYNLTGSITSTSGGFEVDGNVPNNGNFFIRGHFPADASTKSYSVVTATSTQFPQSLTYTGTLSRS